MEVLDDCECEGEVQVIREKPCVARNPRNILGVLMWNDNDMSNDMSDEIIQ
jgi:hypothetical protein